MEWKEQLISTDVDRLLEYLTDEGQVSVSRAAKDLDVTKDRVNTWADALLDAGLIERTYSTTKGKMLRIADREEAEKRIEEVQEETKEEIQEAQGEADPRKEEIQDAWETVEDLIEALEERREIEERIEDDLRELQEEEDHIKEKVEDQDDEIEDELLETLGDIEENLQSIDAIEDEIERFKERRESIESNFKALKKLEEHRKRLKEREKKGNKCEECGRIFDTERGLHVHQAQVHDDDEGGLLRKIGGFLKPW